MSVSAPVVLVLAEGKTLQERSNARGHLFESFIARLLSAYGFSDPSTKNLNVTANGIELDVVATHKLTGERAVVECKAYTTNVRVDALSAFYGDLSVLRLEDPAVFGWFVAIPGLTSEGAEQAKHIESHDSKFRLMIAEDVVRYLRDQHALADAPDGAALISDLATLITEDGIFSAAKTIDSQSRLPLEVTVWGTSPPPDRVLALVEASDYAGGLSVSSADPLSKARAHPVASAPEPTVVEVTGSRADFEYQLPASPKFFVGRRDILQQVEALLRAESGARVIVLNAQSGWGKSSLALRIRQLVTNLSGRALVIDARTAASPEFVWAALREGALQAEARSILTLPADAAFGSLASSLATLNRATWPTRDRPLLIFFDQFESVFHDVRLTQEFRDLALGIGELGLPLIIGFAWKTDIIGWTEGHPYQLRDDIRSAAHVVVVQPFGPSDIQTLLGRLQRAMGAPLTKELRQRLREYSQGLPWLFKKLASHILREVASGVTQDELVAEALNVQRLFESDLAELTPQEQEALRVIARAAPMAVSEVVELVPSAIVQTLVDRRLIVQVGERIDTYWDIFRDFLNTGRVPILETYIMRYAPSSVARLLRLAIEHEGDLTVAEAAAALNTSESMVFNLARELRQMGVLVSAPRRVRIADEIRDAEDAEQAVQSRISFALRRHRAYSMLSEMLEEQGGQVPIAAFADALPAAFPAVLAKSQTWNVYARVYVRWFEYAGLAGMRRDVVQSEPTPEGLRRLTAGFSQTRLPKVFPSGRPRPAMEVLAFAEGQTVDLPMKTGALRRAIRDLRALGVLDVLEHGGVALSDSYLAAIPHEGSLFDNPSRLQGMLRALPGCAEVMDAIAANPKVSKRDLGEIMARAYEAQWAESTKKWIGGVISSWVAMCDGATPPEPGAQERLFVAS
jgi:hypothetical protein